MRVFAACPACAPDGVALKDEAKVLGVRRTESGIVGLRRDKGGLGWIKGDNREGGSVIGGVKSEVFSCDFQIFRIFAIANSMCCSL